MRSVATTGVDGVKPVPFGPASLKSYEALPSSFNKGMDVICIACVMVCRVQTQVFTVILEYPLDKNSNKARPQPPRISGLSGAASCSTDLGLSLLPRPESRLPMVFRYFFTC